MTVREVLEPGQYECRVQYVFPAAPTAWWDKKKDWNSFRFWHEEIQSGPLSLTVHPAKTRSWTFLWPRRLHLGVDGGVYFLEDEAVFKELPVRNGFFIGTFIHDHQTGEQILLSGTPAPYNVSTLVRPKKIPQQAVLSYTIELFESAVPPLRPMSGWSGPMAFDPYEYAGDTNFPMHPSEELEDYKTLLKETFPVESARPDPHLRTN